MRFWLRLILSSWACSAAASVPTGAELTGIHAAAQRTGWSAQSAELRRRARDAYEQGQLPDAAVWLGVYRWAALWGETEAAFIPRWIEAVDRAGVGHQNMASRYETRLRPLGAGLTPELQRWLIGNAELSQEFFRLLQPVDFLPRVLGILDELHRADPARFKAYPNLAVAMAVVYDVPPPPNWPHAQVLEVVLPRRWPDPAEAFRWWTQQDRSGRTYHRLARLGPDELKFMVDTAASFSELSWSQNVSNYPLGQLARAYSMIRYREDRLANQRLSWGEGTYTLPKILGRGGICVDQAYFATHAGKARGVPTLFFHGSGKDGRHAWFGFLDADAKWQLDAGRYAEQRFVTGYARDPQTWLEISDHELTFLAQRFRALPTFQLSQIHASFATDYLATGDAAAAGRAARQAVSHERRNQEGWEILLKAEEALGVDAKRREGVLREAMLAFQLIPDLEAAYSKRISASMRERGETSAADHEQQRIARKYQGDRSDLSLQQARDMLLRSLATQPMREQIRTYNATVDRFGRGAGMGFFDQIVTVFVEHLLAVNERKEAVKAVQRAQGVLKVEPESQLEHEFSKLLQQLET